MKSVLEGAKHVPPHKGKKKHEFLYDTAGQKVGITRVDQGQIIIVKILWSYRFDL